MTAHPPTPTAELNTMNEGADFWRYDIGMNVLPAIKGTKKPIVPWKEHQDNPISQEQHEKWKREGAFQNGILIILGKVWHNRDKQGYYLNCIDADNSVAIQELLARNGKTISVNELARKTIVEQHKDNPNRLHFYVYTVGKPLPDKGSDVIDINVNPENIPAFEVKASSKKLSSVSPSIHKNGHKIEILGTQEVMILGDVEATDFQEYLDNICKKYSLSYNKHGDSNTKKPITDLFKPGSPTLEGHNRHGRLLRMMDSLIVNNRKNMSEEQVKSIAKSFNTTEYLNPPLNDKEFEELWKQATGFYLKEW